ncbi:hypothetical protein FKM82_005793 [Ascaphus truei]
MKILYGFIVVISIIAAIFVIFHCAKCAMLSFVSRKPSVSSHAMYATNNSYVAMNRVYDTIGPHKAIVIEKRT